MTISIASVMTPAPETISASAQLSEAKAAMERLGVNHLPVLQGSVVESIITDGDIKRFTLPAHKIGQDDDLLVGDVATTRALIADSNDDLRTVLEQMIVQRISATVVLNKGELAGLFTDSDACKVLAQLLADSE